MIFRNKRSNEFLIEGWKPLNNSVNRWSINDSLLENEVRLSDLSEPERMVVGKRYEDETLKRLSEFGDRVTIIFGSMSMVHESIKKAGFSKVDGVLADFGTSREQIKSGEGFSFMHDTYLDMRMSKGHSKITAADIIRKATEKELADMFFIYGEERFSRRIAKAIVEERREREFWKSLGNR